MRNNSVSVTLSLSNGFILELCQVGHKHNVTYQQFFDIVSLFSFENLENCHLEQFSYELKELKNSNDGFLRIEKNIREQKHANFLSF